MRECGSKKIPSCRKVEKGYWTILETAAATAAEAAAGNATAAET